VHQNIEAHAMSSVPFVGACSYTPLPPVNTWSVGDFVTAVGVTTSAAIAIVSTGGSNELPALRFRAAATTTDIAKVAFQLPPTLCKSAPFAGSFRKRKLQLILACRTVDLTGSATANADLNLTATATFTAPVINEDTGAMSAGTALFSSDAVTSAELSKAATATDATSAIGYVDAAANVVTGIRLYKFDLTTGLSDAELQSLGPCTLASLAIAPDQTVGTNLALEVFGGWILHDEHLSVWKWVKQLLGH